MNMISQLRAKISLSGEATLTVDEFNQLQSEWIKRCIDNETKQDSLFFVGYTNGAQILYASDSNHGGEGSFYKDTENNCCIPLYMLKTHWHRLQSTTDGEVTLERIREAQKS
jgi:hypothetical protein